MNKLNPANEVQVSDTVNKYIDILPKYGSVTVANLAKFAQENLLSSGIKESRKAIGAYVRFLLQERDDKVKDIAKNGSGKHWHGWNYISSFIKK